MKLKIYTADGAKSQEKDYDAIPQLEGEKGNLALRQYIIAAQANVRQGSANTKNRGEVRGSGKKIFRQKGTGNARHGDRQAPIFVGGGVVFGPRPRDWSKKVNRKVKKLALQRALFNRANEGSLSLIEKITVAEPKTKLFDTLLKKIYDDGKKVLIVEDEIEDNAALAVRNLERVYVVSAESVNPWDLVRFQHILVSEKAFEKLLSRCANG